MRKWLGKLVLLAIVVRYWVSQYTKAVEQLHTEQTNTTSQHSYNPLSKGIEGKTEGKMPVGRILVGRMPVGRIPVGRMPVGRIPVGSEPVGKIPVGRILVGRMSVGKISADNIPVERISVGSIPDGSRSLGTANGSPVDTPVGSMFVGRRPMTS